jgi:hypothetical protein
MTTQRQALVEMIDSTDYTPPEKSVHFHLSLEGEHNPEHVQKALANAGIKACVTPATHERDGLFLTNRMASFTWDSQTGNWNCDKSCSKAGETVHRNFNKLSLEQQFKFVDRVIDLMNNARGDADMDLQEVSKIGPPVRTEECN